MESLSDLSNAMLVEIAKRLKKLEDFTCFRSVSKSIRAAEGMDFVEGLPNSEGKETILVIVDRFTKYAHFIPLIKGYTAELVAVEFFLNVYRLHGLPKNVISDRDKVFTAEFWRVLMQQAGVELKMSSSYHPQTDGQTERVNQCMEMYLRCMAFHRPKKWKSWLPLAEYWYNTTFHSSLNITPFEALYGYVPITLPLGSFGATKSTSVDEFLQQKQAVVRELKDHLIQAQARMKVNADKKRLEKEYNEGDMVLVKLQPYRQTSLAMRRNVKLSAKFFGPFQIEKKLNTVAYKLKLPASSKLHPVFHISLLKKFVGQVSGLISSPPITSDDGNLVLYPEERLSIRTIKRQNSPVVQWLVKWYNLGEDQATWEDYTFLKSHFPEFTQT